MSRARGGSDLRLWSGGAALLTALVGCVAPEGDVGEEAATTSTTQAVTTTNGILFNGLGSNGLAVNGIGLNGIGVNGLAVNGLAVNGLAVNGLAVNGIGVNGIGVNGVAAGLVLNGLAVNGIGVNGLYVNGIGVNGLYVNGLAVNGIATNGIGVNGLAVNGLYVNGLAVNGLAQNGLYVNGLALSGVALHNLQINGSTAATAIKIGLASGALGTLDANQRIELRDRLMPYLAYCALPPSTTNRAIASCATDPGCVSIKDTDGSARYYWGSAGYAPEWKSGPLSVSGSDRVEGCLKAACVSAGGNCQKGIALNAQQEAQLQTLFKYAVSCALPAPSGAPPTTESTCAASPGCASIRNSSGAAVLYLGAMGLAPEWKTGALSAAGQQRVSACLAARTNANGEHVLISMRGAGLSAGPLEKARFRRHEGAFYGNVFAATPTLRSCEVDGGDMAGRVCANGQCGFVWDGECKTACASPGASGTYDSCAGNAQVLNTFLPFQKTAAVGDSHVCAIDADGFPWCWGDNSRGNLGDGTITTRNTSAKPVLLAGDFSVDQVVAGARFSCARKTNGTLWCWGRNEFGMMADGTLTDRPTPVQVPLTSVIDVDAQSYNACALTSDGSAYCWGKNDRKQVGDGTITTRKTPYKVAALGSGVVAIGSGLYFTCALKGDGTVWCWGGNDRGQLGDGTMTDRAAPVQVAALGTRTVQLTVSPYSTCALRDDATVWCWGDGWFGQLGNGVKESTASRKSTPQQVKLSSSTALTDVVQVHGGDDHACAVKRDGTAWCWGSNDLGQIGNGGTAHTAWAVQVGALGGNVAAVRASYDYTCAQLRDQTERCWGRNDNGQIGDKTTVARPSPTRATMLLKADAVCNWGESSITEASQCAAPEECQDGLDNDGDGQTDCADGDCSGEATCAAP